MGIELSILDSALQPLRLPDGSDWLPEIISRMQDEQLFEVCGIKLGHLG